jgi:hypothetical protein
MVDRQALLIKRIERPDPFGDVWLKGYYKSILEHFEIDDLSILICNTLQRRTSITKYNREYILVFDNYVLELFSIFNQLVFDCADERYIEALYYRILSEAYFVCEKYNLSLRFNYKYVLIMKSLPLLEIREISKSSEPKLSYIQQAFILSHEVVHYLFDTNNNAKENYMGTTKTVIKNISKYERFSQIYNSLTENYLEEYACDHIAVYLALDVALKENQYTLENGVTSIMSSMYYQYILKCLDFFVSNNLIVEETEKFLFRMTIAELAIRNYIKSEFGNVDASVEKTFETSHEKFVTYLLPQLEKLLKNEISNISHYEISSYTSKQIKQAKNALYRRFTQK